MVDSEHSEHERDLWRQQPDTVPRPDPTRLTTDVISREMISLRAIMEAKYDGRIDVLKTRMDGNDTALIAALQAAKELVGVNNQFATKAIDQQGTAFKASLDSTIATIADVKDRLTRIEGRTSGAGSTVATTVAIAAAGAAVFIAMLTWNAHQGQPSASPAVPLTYSLPVGPK